MAVGCCDVHSKKIHGLARGLECDSRVGENDDADGNQKGSDDGLCIHIRFSSQFPFVRPFQVGLPAVVGTVENHESSDYAPLRRPEMKLTNIMMTATTSRMWMNPPMAVLVTSPSNHKTIKTTAMVYIIYFLFCSVLDRFASLLDILAEPVCRLASATASDNQATRNKAQHDFQ